MENFDWESRVREWSQKRIEALEDYEKEQLPLEVIESGYLGYPGATEEQIATTEARLGVTFPPSYREFIKGSNGLRSISEYGIRFYSVEEVDFYALGNQDFIDEFMEIRKDRKPIPDEEYFIYGNEQVPYAIRPEHLQTALEISSEELSGIYLLNPQVITSDGEWETWYFDYKLGEDRYRSFGEMMDVILSDPEWFL